MPDLSKATPALIIPATMTVSRGSGWVAEGTALKAFSPDSVSYKVPEGEYLVSVVGQNHGDLPLRPGFAFALTINGKAAAIPYGMVVSTPITVAVGAGGLLNISWTNDDYVAGKYDSNLKLVEVRLDPTTYDPTLDVIKKLTGLTYTPLSDKEAAWLLGI